MKKIGSIRGVVALLLATTSKASVIASCVAAWQSPGDQNQFHPDSSSPHIEDREKNRFYQGRRRSAPRDDSMRIRHCELRSSVAISRRQLMEGSPGALPTVISEAMDS